MKMQKIEMPWESPTKDVLAKQGQKIQQIIDNTTKNVQPLIKETIKNVWQWEMENGQVVMEAAEKQKNDPKRQEIQKKVATITNQLKSGYRDLRRVVMSAQREVSNAGDELMREVSQMQRKDQREDR